MTNDKLNEQLISDADAKKKYYYKRVGECDPSKCGGACCRYTIAGMHYEGYHKLVFEWSKNPIDIFGKGKDKFVVFSFHCPKITIDGRCSLHGKKEQPVICDWFPMVPSDAVYKYVKKVCGYRFEKTEIPMRDK